MIKVEQAKELTYRQELYHQSLRGSDKQPIRVRVNGKCKLWKRSPERFQVPVKHGLYDSGYITETNCHDWCLTEDDAMLHPLRYFGDWNLYFNKTGLRPTKYICSACKQMKHIPKDNPGYTLDTEKIICYECGDKKIIELMKEKGKAYLTCREATRQSMELYYKEFKEKHPGTFPIEKQYLDIFAFTGQPVFRSFQFYKEKHFLHVWFMGPDNFIWYGRVSLKRNSESTNLFCKRTKKTKW